MSAPRRRIVRPPTQPPDPNNHVRVQKLRVRLECERAALLRWQARLKRAFNTVQKTQARITRLERQLARPDP
ncbi:MAG: hypothetical protein JNM56_31920 [Planctomycetia bacterium]|nr:hypothetical protein [Planctomycetia bacterium]